MCVLDTQTCFWGFSIKICRTYFWGIFAIVCKINHLFYVVCDKVFLSRFEEIVYLTRPSSPSPSQFLFFPLQLFFPPHPFTPHRF